MPLGAGRTGPPDPGGPALGEWESDFDRLARVVQRALLRAGTHDLADLRAGIRAGQYQFWPGIHSAIVTQLVDHPQRRELVFFLAAGILPEIQALYPLILDWGIAKGCSHAAFVGRLGWGRTWLTKTEGWRLTQAVFEKDLPGEQIAGPNQHSNDGSES